MEENVDFEKVGAEVYAVLKSIPNREYNKVSKKVRELFEKYEKASNQVKIDISKSFNEQNISKKAKEIIFVISLNYWLTEEQRKIAIEKMNKNEKELNEKYNIEKIFKEKNKTAINTEKQESEISSNKYLTKVTNSWFNKVLRFIKRFFRKR